MSVWIIIMDQNARYKTYKWKKIPKFQKYQVGTGEKDNFQKANEIQI